MTQTLVTTWVQLFGETLRSSANADAASRLELSDSSVESPLDSVRGRAHHGSQPGQRAVGCCADRYRRDPSAILTEERGATSTIRDGRRCRAELSSIDLTDTLDAFLADLPEDEPEEEDAPKRWPDSYAGFLTKPTFASLIAAGLPMRPSRSPDNSPMWIHWLRLAYVNSAAPGGKPRGPLAGN